MFGFSVFAAAAALSTGPTLVDPYAATAPGWVLCLDPDDKALTCSNLSSFAKTGAGTYRAHSVSSFTGADFLIEYDSDIKVVDGKDCGPMRYDSFQNLRFRRGDRYLAGSELAAAEARVKRAYVGAGNTQGCSTISGEANRLTLSIEIIGQPKPGYYVVLRSAQFPIKWVHVDDGYTVQAWRGVKN